MTQASPPIPLSSLPPEDIEAQNTRYGSKGLRVTPLASTGRFSISDTWGRLITRADVERLGGPPAGEAPESFGFALGELQKALFLLFFPDGGWDFSMPKAWGWEARQAGKTPNVGLIPTSLTSSVSASDLGF